MAKISPETLYMQEDSDSDIELTDFDMPYHDENLRKGISASKAPDRNFLFISDPKRIRWDVCIIVFAIYNCFTAPYQVSFQLDVATPVYLDIIDTVIDLLFMVDIYLNFITSYIDLKTGDEITDKAKIARNYMKSLQFGLDVVSCVPVELLALFLTGLDSSVGLIKLLKLLRIFRLSRIIHYMRVKEEVKILMRIGKLIIFILIYLHFLACGWNVLVSVEETWVPGVDLSEKNFERFYEIEPLTRYLYAYYTATASLVRFEIFPSTKYEYLFSMISILLGALIMTYMLGEISVLVANMNRAMGHFYKAMDTISTAMKNLKLPAKLQLKITQYFISTNHFLTHNEEWEKFQKIVPPSIIREVNLHLYKELVRNHYVFADFPEISDDIVSSLGFKFFRPDNYLIQAGEESEFFCFIAKGKFEVSVVGLNYRDIVVAELNSGEYCGEIGLLYNVRRTATVRATDYCSVGIFSKEVFLGILKKDAGFEARMKEAVCEYKDPYKSAIIVVFT